MSILKLLWGFVSGFSMRTYLILAAVVAFAAWSGYVYSTGYAAADAKWRALNYEAKIAKLEMEKKVLTEAAELDAKYRDELATENEQQKKVIDEFLENNEKRPDKCLLGDDADKLNGL